MKTKLFPWIIFVVFLNSVIRAQILGENCPASYTHAKIIDSQVRIANVDVKESSKYSVLPSFINDLDSVSSLIIYPDIARRAEIECTLKLILTIDSTGNVMNTNVLKGCGAGLEEAAIESLLKEQFYPAKISEKRVESEIIVDIIFDLNVYFDKPDLLFDEIKFQLDGNLPALHQTIIYRSDGTAYFQEDYGYKESEKNLTGKIYKSGFTKLNDFIISQCFLNFENEYISQNPSDYPTIKITVQNDNITKSVTAKGEGYAPISFWAIKNVIRYLKDQIKWEEVKK